MKRILVCLDHSSLATFVFLHAREFAERTRTKMVFLHVVVPDHGLTLPGVETSPEMVERTKQAQLELLVLADQVPKENFGSAVVGVGEPWRVICRTAQDIDAEYVLLGCHGTVGVIEKLFGTTAERVVRHVDRSVVVLRKTPRL